MSTLFKLRNPDWNEPEWFTEIVESVEEKFSSRHDAGIDHIRSYKGVVVLQPYHAKGEALLTLLSACKERGLKVFVSGKTNYYPSATFTIVIYKPEDERRMSEFANAALSTDIKVPIGLS
jgi:hypothetical protein